MIEPTRRAIGAAIRMAGLVAVVFVAVSGGAATSDVPGGNWAILFGVLSLAAFLWLTLSGFFGYGDARRSDWVGLVPFCIALLVRERFTLHSVQEIEIQFAQGPVGRHSVVYPLLQMFFAPIVRDPQSFTMHMNGVLGALASLSMYLFVRQRLESRSAGFLCALFLATDPFLARFSPTDGPYSLLLATWFSGLALLSARKLDARSLFGGAVLLGIAATTRMEAGVLLVASLLLLDLRRLLDGVRRYRTAAAFSILAVAALATVQMYFLLGLHLGGPTALSALIPPLRVLYAGAVAPASYNDPVFVGLIWIGVLAGIVSRLRLGLFAFLAILVVLAPLANSWECGPIVLHRMIPACALQTIVAGIGAYSLTAWIPATSRWRWCAVIPGAVAAFYALGDQRAGLTQPYLFTQEYELVRSHLAPRGIPATGCTLLTFNSVVGQDVDIHDFGQVVPGVRVVNCRSADCIAEASAGNCIYYVRSAGSYFHPDGIPSACAETGVGAEGDRLGCLDAPSAAFEASVHLQAVDVLTSDIVETFPDRRANYPAQAEIGLFRVRSRSGDADHGKAP